MKRKSLLLVGLFVMIFFITTNVSAANTAYSPYGSITVPNYSDTYVQTTASYTYPYAMNRISSYSGSATVHSELYTRYGGSQTKMGNALSLSSTGISLWKPTSVSSTPSGFTITNQTTCPYGDRTQYNCIISGSTYAIRLNNKNLISSFTVSGSIIFTE